MNKRATFGANIHIHSNIRKHTNKIRKQKTFNLHPLWTSRDLGNLNDMTSTTFNHVARFTVFRFNILVNIT